jgi:hypothetical protein
MTFIPLFILDLELGRFYRLVDWILTCLIGFQLTSLVIPAIYDGDNLFEHLAQKYVFRLQSIIGIVVKTRSFPGDMAE